MSAAWVPPGCHRVPRLWPKLLWKGYVDWNFIVNIVRSIFSNPYKTTFLDLIVYLIIILYLIIINYDKIIWLFYYIWLLFLSGCSIPNIPIIFRNQLYLWVFFSANPHSIRIFMAYKYIGVCPWKSKLFRIMNKYQSKRTFYISMSSFDTWWFWSIGYGIWNVGWDRRSDWLRDISPLEEGIHQLYPIQKFEIPKPLTIQKSHWRYNNRQHYVWSVVSYFLMTFPTFVVLFDDLSNFLT